MKVQRIGSALFILLVSSTSGLAAATAEDAARIQKTLQSYFGTEPGVVSVTPAGEGYDIALDAMPYVKKAPAGAFTVAIDPYRFNAVPKGDGLWAVTSSGPYKMSFDAPAISTFKLEATNLEWSGTYSDTLLAFVDQTFNISKLSINQTTLDPESKIGTTAITAIEQITGTGVAKDAGNGLTDGQSTFNATGIITSTTMTIPPEMQSAGMPNFSYVANIAKGTYVTDTKGVNSKAVAELLAFFVANPSKDLLVPKQAEMKEKLLAALPFFNSIQSDSNFEGSTIDTGLGSFGLGSMGLAVGMNGATKNGRLAEQFSFSGITLPNGLPLPPWSAGLIPSSFKIGFDLSDFDLETPARKFITEMDISKPEPVPPGSEAAYLAAFSPTKTMKITLPPGEITAEKYTINYEGVTDISLAGGLPSVKATVRMKGMDAVIAQLQQAAADPMAQQGMAMLFAAKGIGKADGETTSWDITMSPEGKLLVNGTDMSAMMGAIAPPAQQPQQ
jgi:hypothetical protein